MTKKFELSAYGVEEMNQKELVDVERGIWWWVVILGVCLLMQSDSEPYASGFADSPISGTGGNSDMNGRQYLLGNAEYHADFNYSRSFGDIKVNGYEISIEYKSPTGIKASH
jgi:hypothetical protein